MQEQTSTVTRSQQKQFDACLICNHQKLISLTRYAKAYLVQCDNCSFIFCNRIPSVDELVGHYNTYPRNENISPITLKRYHELLDSFQEYRKTGNILDVGCGNGHFLSEAKKTGWNVFGTEYTDTAIAICRSKNITMFEGKLDPKVFGDIKFDVITSFEVLEHINNPVEEISNFNALLHEGGIVYLTTPNFNSLSRIVLKEKWTIIEYPEHLSYYSFNTLKRLFNQGGFKKKFLKTTGISLNRLQQSTNKSVNAVITKNNDETLREKSESNVMFAILKKMANTVLTILKKGDTLKALFIKK